MGVAARRLRCLVKAGDELPVAPVAESSYRLSGFIAA
jgi:hypothetical protein